MYNMDTYTKSDIIIYAILSAIGGIVLYALVDNLMNKRKNKLIF